MKIGYPCINNSLGCTASRTFRLKSYSAERLVAALENNLECLLHILCYNLARDILFFRISSDLVPFASHRVCRFNWREFFKHDFERVGAFITENRIRISMHPDQFTLINSPDRVILSRSVRELEYHEQVLDLMGLGSDAKIQIHVGGVYNDKAASMKRFVARYKELSPSLKKRLVIENDDRLYSIADCMAIHGDTGVPVLFDSLHHQLNNNGESLHQALDMVFTTWCGHDGRPMVDYSLQRRGERPGKHAQSLNVRRFKEFLTETQPFDFDVMLEIKDKEKAAAKAVKAAYLDPRFIPLGT